MKHLSALLALPTSLLNIITAQAQELPWPQNLPRTVRYYPQDEAHLKRQADVQERLAWQTPSEVRKMRDDEGEKFFLGYWGFGDGNDDDTAGLLPYAPGDLEKYWNASTTSTLRAAIAPHSKNDLPRFRLFGRSIFERDFKCPSGTKSCSSIGEHDLCCATDETCVSTSEGPGCCPAGATCGNNVANCDTDNGYTSCPHSPNGGCCIPGAECQGVGCVFLGTHTVTTTAETATKTTRASLSTESQPTVEVSVTTRTVTITPGGTTTTQTVIISGGTSSTQTCRNGYFSCPASIGGGCCPDGQACGGDGECPYVSTSTSATARQPDLPTSISASPETQSSTPPAGCPTGFYMCSARYLGGCCRVGRDCHTTSCPPQATRTLVQSSRATIGVTSNANSQATGGSCANGWSLCGQDGGGGCCPSGYVCGQTSCTATVQGEDNTLKMAPNSANAMRWAWSFLALGVVAGIGMIYL